MKPLWQSPEAQAFTPCVVAAMTMNGRPSTRHDSETYYYKQGRWPS